MHEHKKPTRATNRPSNTTNRKSHNSAAKTGTDRAARSSAPYSRPAGAGGSRPYSKPGDGAARSGSGGSNYSSRGASGSTTSSRSNIDSRAPRSNNTNSTSEQPARFDRNDRPERARTERTNSSFTRSDRPARSSASNGADSPRPYSKPRDAGARPGGNFSSGSNRGSTNENRRSNTVDTRPRRNSNEQASKFERKDNSVSNSNVQRAPKENKDSNYFSHKISSEPVRIHKILAELGIASRREIEDLIVLGKVWVNGSKAILGQKIGISDTVQVSGKTIDLQRIQYLKPRIIIYHKPSNEIVSHDDPENRPTVFSNLPYLTVGKWLAVGRLDYNTEGLLIFTNNGHIANQLMHPKFEIEREYAVRVIGELEESAKLILLEGVLLEDGMAKFSQIKDGGGESLNHWYHVTIAEGRNREVRRMFEAIGLTVSRLTRIRYGTMRLPQHLSRGQWQELTKIEIDEFLGNNNIEYDKT